MRSARARRSTVREGLAILVGEVVLGAPEVDGVGAPSTRAPLTSTRVSLTSPWAPLTSTRAPLTST
eukprot:6506969-Pyramimonas_sp.AAC.1